MFKDFKGQGDLKEAEERDERTMLRQIAEHESKAELEIKKKRDVEEKNKSEAKRALNL